MAMSDDIKKWREAAVRRLEALRRELMLAEDRVQALRGEQARVIGEIEAYDRVEASRDVPPVVALKRVYPPPAAAEEPSDAVGEEPSATAG